MAPIIRRLIGSRAREVIWIWMVMDRRRTQYGTVVNSTVNRNDAKYYSS